MKSRAAVSRRFELMGYVCRLLGRIKKMEIVEIDKEWIEYFEAQGIKGRPLLDIAKIHTEVTQIKAQMLANEIDREIIEELEKQT